jgi:hypothetical protein
VAEMTGAEIRTSLADLMLGDAACASAAAARLAATNGWGTAVALSGQWRVATTLHGKLEAFAAAGTAVAIDAESRAQLRRLAVIAAAQTTLVLQRSRAALEVIERAGCEAVAIKGIALIAGLYDGRATRMVSDLDIIVREREFATVKAALEAAGYEDRSPEFERHVADIGASERLHNYARTFVRDGLEVDAHWQFGPHPPAVLATEHIIRRSQRVSLGKTEVSVASPIDAMLIGTHHALRGYFVPRETIKDLCDLAAWWTLGRTQWNLDDLIAAAHEAEIASSLCALWRILCRRDRAHPAAQGIAAIERTMRAAARAEARNLAQFFEDQLAEGNHAERTVQMFAVSVAGRSMIARSRGWLSRRARGEGEVSTYVRRPWPARITHFIERMSKVARELGRVRSFAAYRAVARAQSRYH